MKTVIIDTLGGDLGSEQLVLGALDALEQCGGLKTVLAGDKAEIEPLIRERPDLCDRIEIADRPHAVTNNDPPTAIMSTHADSSMASALDRLKTDGNACGLLSAGSTGALLVGSIFRLGLFEGLRQPALCSAIPRLNTHDVCVVDCGSAMDCTPAMMARFALLGTAFMRSMYGIANPKVGLLSVGREPKKGNAQTLAAFEQIAALPLDFVGNVESENVFCGNVDVVVCDGFAGNVLLKNTETVGKTAMAAMREAFDADEIAASPKLRRLYERLYGLFELNKQGGAVFLGTKKPIIKMHGCAERETVSACVKRLLQFDLRKFSAELDGAFVKNRT